jgi:NACHT domain
MTPDTMYPSNHIPRISVISGEEILVIIDTLLRSNSPLGHLNDMQSIVLRKTWEDLSYQQIADDFGYQVDYIRQIASHLWRVLSAALGEKVSKKNLHSVVRRYYRHRPIVIHSTESRIGTERQDWGEAIDVSVFHGRQSELTKLEQWIAWNHCRLVGVYGLEGIGKTAFSIKLAQKLAWQFDYIIWRSLRQTPLPQAFCTDILMVLQGNEQAIDQSLSIGILIQQLQEKRCLLIIDSVDSVLQAGDNTGKYLPSYEAYHQLFEQIATVNHQSCVLLTSREQPPDLNQWNGDNLPVRSIVLPGLSGAAGQQILADKGLVASNLEQDALIHHFGGNPLMLKMAATKIQNLFSGDVCQFLAQNHTVFSNLWDLCDRQSQRLSPWQRSLMYWIAINQGSCDIQLLQAQTQAPMRDILVAIESLHNCALITSTPAGLSQHPAVMEYWMQQGELKFCT